MVGRAGRDTCVAVCRSEQVVGVTVGPEVRGWTGGHGGVPPPPLPLTSLKVAKCLVI